VFGEGAIMSVRVRAITLVGMIFVAAAVAIVAFLNVAH
jgi:hypothetical protein